jgi:hypothetical protein
VDKHESAKRLQRPVRVKTVGIFNKGKSIICDLVDKQNVLVVRSVIYASLKNAASMTVGCNCYAIGS